MASELSLFLFVDALGWEVLKAHPFFLKEYERKKLRTVLGYSSACDPSIISGALPSQHGHWSCFYYSPTTCPYPWVKYLSFLPKTVTNHHRIRHYLSALIARLHGITGYFQIYNVPFQVLPYFDYAEKKWMWYPHGLIQGESIVDHLNQNRVPYYVKGPFTSEREQWVELDEKIEAREIQFAYLFFGELDALMHAKGPHHADVAESLQRLDQKIRELVSSAEKKYRQVNWTIFSDHGMHAVSHALDLQAVVNQLGFKIGKDYVAMYDSTMVRLWYLLPGVRDKILAALGKVTQGRFLSDAELQKLGVFFPDRKYGEDIFLIQAPYLIIPSYMGLKLISGMHGYHPDDPDSAAAILSSSPIPESTVGIEHVFNHMMRCIRSI